MGKFKRGREYSLTMEDLRHIASIRHIWHRRTESEFLGVEIIFTLEEAYIKEHLLEDYISTYYNDCDDELKDNVRKNVLTGAEFIVNVCLDNIWAENIQDFSDIVSISAFDFDIENDIDSMLVVGEYEDVFDKFIFLYSKALLYRDLGMILNLEESKEIKDKEHNDILCNNTLHQPRSRAYYQAIECECNEANPKADDLVIFFYNNIEDISKLVDRVS